MKGHNMYSWRNFFFASGFIGVNSWQSSFSRRKFFPLRVDLIWKGFVFQSSKQEVTEVFPFVKMAEKYRSVLKDPKGYIKKGLDYSISSVISQSFFFQNNPKNPDPSYKMDLWIV